MPRKMLILTFLLLLTAGNIHAQDYDLDGLLENYVADNDPGVVVFISDGDNTWTAVRGLADVEASTPMQVTDHFRIASMTKPFVAVVMLQLAEEGQLDLDDRISDYLPAEIISQIEYGDRITIRQLLNMTSGIFDYLTSDEYNEILDTYPNHVWTAAETISLVDGVEAYFPPGEGYFYSNTNYSLLEMIIDAVTNSTLSEQLQERIFDPLGMRNSFVEDGNALGAGIVHGYEDWDEDGELEDVTFVNDSAGLAAVGIVSTAADLDLFLRGWRKAN